VELELWSSIHYAHCLGGVVPEMIRAGCYSEVKIAMKGLECVQSAAGPGPGYRGEMGWAAWKQMTVASRVTQTPDLIIVGKRTRC
jgi:hypothetical protein